ncbi:MAG: MOSC domain-containing protein [Oceanobacter sp.]
MSLECRSAVVNALYIYPIKSCKGVKVETVLMDSVGPVGDRRFMVVDDNGRFVTQRECPDMSAVEVGFQNGELAIGLNGQVQCLVPLEGEGERKLVSVWRDEVSAVDCGKEAAQWFSELLGKSCSLVRLDSDSNRQVDPVYSNGDAQVSFADGFPLLVVNQKSVDELSRRLGREVDVERFRPNVVVDADLPFEELNWMRLLQAGDSGGALELVKPCERCVIPMRDLTTQKKEADMISLMKEICLHDSKIIFGQNALATSISSLKIGDQFEIQA